jgi:hypothetical protein
LGTPKEKSEKKSKRRSGKMPDNPMPDRFIVTVVSGDFEADLEIPSRLTFGEMKEKLLEILKMLGGKEFRDWRECSLRCKGRILADGETLASAGAFDGAQLSATRAGGPGPGMGVGGSERKRPPVGRD